MAKRTRAQLKSTFSNNQVPTETGFGDLIDSFVNLSDTEEQALVGGLRTPNLIADGLETDLLDGNTGTIDEVTVSSLMTTDLTVAGNLKAVSISAVSLHGVTGSFDTVTTNSLETIDFKMEGDLDLANLEVVSVAVSGVLSAQTGVFTETVSASAVWTNVLRAVQTSAINFHAVSADITHLDATTISAKNLSVTNTLDAQNVSADALWVSTTISADSAYIQTVISAASIYVDTLNGTPYEHSWCYLNGAWDDPANTIILSAMTTSYRLVDLTPTRFPQVELQNFELITYTPSNPDITTLRYTGTTARFEINISGTVEAISPASMRWRFYVLRAATAAHGLSELFSYYAYYGGPTTANFHFSLQTTLSPNQVLGFAPGSVTGTITNFKMMGMNISISKIGTG